MALYLETCFYCINTSKPSSSEPVTRTSNIIWGVESPAILRNFSLPTMTFFCLHLSKRIDIRLKNHRNYFLQLKPTI